VEVLGIAHPTSDVAPHVTISLGVATGRAVNDDDPASLVGRADAALYEAKSLGRNRSRLHRGAMGRAHSVSLTPCERLTTR
jgi:PleD family two-component response regulator